MVSLSVLSMITSTIIDHYMFLQGFDINFFFLIFKRDFGCRHAGDGMSEDDGRPDHM